VRANPHCESDCPRNLTNIRCVHEPVNATIPQNFHPFSTIGKPSGSERTADQGELKESSNRILKKPCHSESGGTPGEEPAFPVAQKRATVWPSAFTMPPATHFGAVLYRHATAEDRKLKKELLEVLTLKVPFRTQVLSRNSGFRIKPRGRGDSGNQSLLYIRCRTRTRVAEMRPASHTHALGSLFIADECEKLQAGI
jgi:hypothetical protein